MNIHVGKHIVVGCSALTLSAQDQHIIRQVQPVGLLLHPGLLPINTGDSGEELLQRAKGLIQEFRKLIIAPRFLLVADLGAAPAIPSSSIDPLWLTRLLRLEKLDPDATLIIMGELEQLEPYRAISTKSPQASQIILAPRCFSSPPEATQEEAAEARALLRTIDCLLAQAPTALSLGAQYCPALDTLYPAPLSEILVQQTLRDERKFQGLLLCESVELPLAAELFNTPYGIFRSLAIGVDLFIVPRSFAAPWVDSWLLALNQRLPEAFDNFKISRQQLARAAQRIDALFAYGAPSCSSRAAASNTRHVGTSAIEDSHC